MSETKSAAEILREARALIDTPEKWFKGDAFGPNGEMCALAAYDTAAGEEGLPPRPLYVALPNDVFKSVAYYNDHPDTTHDDIMALFDRAIALAEAGDA